MTLKGGQRHVDVPFADLLIHELAELQVDGEPALAVAQGERKNLQRSPFKGLQSRQVLELGVLNRPRLRFALCRSS